VTRRASIGGDSLDWSLLFQASLPRLVFQEVIASGNQAVA
jgi:hypothetical protein